MSAAAGVSFGPDMLSGPEGASAKQCGVLAALRQADEPPPAGAKHLGDGGGVVRAADAPDGAAVPPLAGSRPPGAGGSAGETESPWRRAGAGRARPLCVHRLALPRLPSTATANWGDGYEWRALARSGRRAKGVPYMSLPDSRFI